MVGRNVSSGFWKSLSPTPGECHLVERRPKSGFAKHGSQTSLRNRGLNFVDEFYPRSSSCTIWDLGDNDNDPVGYFDRKYRNVSMVDRERAMGGRTRSSGMSTITGAPTPGPMFDASRTPHEDFVDRGRYSNIYRTRERCIRERSSLSVYSYWNSLDRFCSVEQDGRYCVPDYTIPSQYSISRRSPATPSFPRWFQSQMSATPRRRMRPNTVRHVRKLDSESTTHTLDKQKERRSTLRYPLVLTDSMTGGCTGPATLSRHKKFVSADVVSTRNESSDVALAWHSSVHNTRWASGDVDRDCKPLQIIGQVYLSDLGKSAMKVPNNSPCPTPFPA